MDQYVLVLNCGSSSIKFAIIEAKTGMAPLHGLAENLGTATSKLGFNSLAKGTAINSAGSLYSTSTGQIIKTAETLSKTKPSLLSRLTTPFSKSTPSVGATAASAASTTSAVSSSAASATAIKNWFKKYPRLAKWGPRIPWIGKILAGGVAASIILDPEKSNKEKG